MLQFKRLMLARCCLTYLPFGQHIIVELVPRDESKHVGIFSLPHSQNCVHTESQPEPEDEAGQKRDLFISCKRTKTKNKYLNKIKKSRNT